MTDYWDDPTQEGTGLLTYYEGTIIDSFWSNLAAETQGKVTGQGSENTQLFWNVRIDDILQDYHGTVPETVIVNFGVGAKWWPNPEDENRVDHEDDHPDAEVPIKFNNSSGFGRVLSMVANKGEDALGEYKIADGGPAVTVSHKGVGQYFRDNGFADARDATIWQGLKFRFRGLSFPYKDSDKKKQWGNGKAYPTEFLGTEDNPVTTETPAEANLGNFWEEATDKNTATQLAKLVKSSSSHEGFVKNAMLLPAVKDSEELQAAVNDPANYGS